MTYIITTTYTNFLIIILILFILTLVCIRIALGHFLILLLFLDFLLILVICVFAWQVAATLPAGCHDILSGYLADFNNQVTTYTTEDIRPVININGYSFALLTLGVAAADTAVGLGLFIIYYKATGEISIKNNV